MKFLRLLLIIVISFNVITTQIIQIRVNNLKPDESLDENNSTNNSDFKDNILIAIISVSIGFLLMSLVAVFFLIFGKYYKII